MITKTDKPSTPAPEVAVETQPVKNALSLADRHRPLVVRVKGKKKKKRKYSKGTKGLQITLRKGTRVSSRLTNAIADGFDVYRKKSNRSSRKRRDGVLRDLLKNSASGVSKTLRKGSKVPVLLAKTVRTKAVRRSLRRVARMFGG